MERPKGELFKKVEVIEKKFEKFEKEMKEMNKMLKEKLIDTQFVEEEIVIDVKYINAGADRIMLIDSGASKSIMSSKLFESYLKDAKVSGEEVKKKKCGRRLRMGKTVYLSTEELTFQRDDTKPPHPKQTKTIPYP